MQRTEEYVLRHDGLLGQLAEVALPRRRVWHRLHLDARPGQVDVEQEEQHAEAYNGRLGYVSISALRAPRGGHTSNRSPSRMRVLCSKWR